MTKADIPEVFALGVRTLEQIKTLDFTESAISTILFTSHYGCVCLNAGQIVGFAMGNHETGEMWVIAVAPDFEGRGIGRELLHYVQNWLWEKGWSEIWLKTDIDTSLRSYGFYKKMGWEDLEIKDGVRYMILKNPNLPGRHIAFLQAAKKSLH